MPAFEDQVQAPEQQGVASGPGEGSQGILYRKRTGSREIAGPEWMRRAGSVAIYCLFMVFIMNEHDAIFAFLTDEQRVAVEAVIARAEATAVAEAEARARAEEARFQVEAEARAVAEEARAVAEEARAVAEEARAQVEAENAQLRTQLQVRWLRYSLEQAMRDAELYHRSLLTRRCIPAGWPSP